MERLQKYMASCGIGSRRKCEEIISSGRVTVNGQRATDMGIKIDPGKDIVLLDNKRVLPEDNKIYILLNKPAGVITSSDDQFRRKTVLDCIGDVGKRVFPIGRLDYETEGLIILTNDGELTNLMTHPSHEVEKEYAALVKGVPDDNDLAALRSGIDIGGYITRPARVKIMKIDENGNAYVSITLKEGKNRQVRRMLDAVNHRVLKLKRIRIGSIRLGDLKPGEWRMLSPGEVSRLKHK